MSSQAIPQGRGARAAKEILKSPREKQQVVQTQTELIRKNISAITEVQRQEDGRRSPLDRVADGITKFSGSMTFVILHVIWFGVWVLLNVGLVRLPRVSEFDPFPFGLLTMIVSLEAIFLSTFVLISQNRMARLSEQRAELDLHVNLLAEQKATKALELLDQITEQLNSLKRFNFRRDPEVEALKVSPEPQEVLQVMREAVAEEAEEVKQKVKQEVKDEVKGEVKDEVKDEVVKEISGEFESVRRDVDEVTGETEVVKAEVREMDDKVEAVADELQEMKQGAGAREEEWGAVSLR
ncbi:MAG TPA: DUF1003 domain-containing protein [Pyrinomonadaceae bacterium]|nr:DUF1003 domain-containing protein [Pyrinomonadaceae bacterium]